jgi:hypothetical protein
MIDERNPSRASPLVPVSWGELFDKISILQIKAERVTASEAHDMVLRELEALLQCVPAELSESQGVTKLRGNLRRVNEELWNVEDRLRLCEARRCFDDHFVQLARSVYIANDRRAAVKRALNELLGSQLVEVKQHPKY